ncbi:MAG TPA: CNNM domain-containing protein [Candidatus Saccharimonadales bacterium]|nr:CNNM domain-containing protein [Candidatus Saccharimonadales bacterium]
MATLLDVLLIVVLIVFSAVCSGLNIGLMSLKIGDLRRQAKLGDWRAKQVLPLRERTHLALASILLTNVAVISATSLLLERYFIGWIAGIASTLLIVIFGEVVPQALFVKRALLYCALLAPLLKLMVAITYPISKPLQLLLDALLGPEHAQLQSRRELGLLIGEHATNEHSELDDSEIDIMRGALSLSEKRVRDIMTPLGKVYWLTPGTVINAKKIDEIKAQGRSRIPIFNKARTVCEGVLLMKDLVDVDFDGRSYRATELPLYRAQPVGSMTALDTLFRKFIHSKTHLLPVERDDTIVGIVTIEDLIEEILQHEIEDEADHARKRQTTRSR